MTRAPEPPSVGGVPASIAAIMAAIRHEVAAPPRAVEAPPAPPPVAPSVAAAPDAPSAAPVPGPSPLLPAEIEALTRDLLAPQLKAWLDAHLPEIVETAVHAEIRRLTGQA